MIKPVAAKSESWNIHSHSMYVADLSIIRTGPYLCGGKETPESHHHQCTSDQEQMVQCMYFSSIHERTTGNTVEVKRTLTVTKHGLERHDEVQYDDERQSGPDEHQIEYVKTGRGGTKEKNYTLWKVNLKGELEHLKDMNRHLS